MYKCLLTVYLPFWLIVICVYWQGWSQDVRNSIHLHYKIGSGTNKKVFKTHWFVGFQPCWQCCSKDGNSLSTIMVKTRIFNQLQDVLLYTIMVPNPNDLCVILTFPIVPPSGRCLVLSSEILNYWGGLWNWIYRRISPAGWFTFVILQYNYITICPMI